MAVGFDEAGNNLLRLALDGLQFARSVGYLLLGIRLTLLPQHFEHGVYGEQHLLRGTHGFNQAVKGRFQIKLADVLTRLLAALGEAPIIGVVFAFAATRPGGGHRAVAARAIDEAAQREVVAQIRAIWRDRLATVQPLFDLQKRFIVYERLVLGRDAVHSPFRNAHVSGIEHLRQNLAYLLRMHGAKAVLWENWLVLQEALYFGLRFEAV